MLTPPMTNLSCYPRFYCNETVSSICDDSYTYTCKYFEPQTHPEYDFSKYCKWDENRCGECTCKDANIYAMSNELKKYGRTLGRVVYKVPSPTDYGEDSFNNKG